MNLIFKDINNSNFHELVSTTRNILSSQTFSKKIRKELIDFISKDERMSSEEEIRFIYSLENPENINVLIKSDFNPENFELKIPTTFIGKTQSGGIITVDERNIGDFGGIGKYVCDHTSRITNSFKQTNLYPPLFLTGFIHVPECPNEKQFSEVIGLGILSLYEKYSGYYENEPFRIMLTGFTKFRNIKDNSTGKFLFGDGTSDNTSSFAFKESSKDAIERLDGIMQELFGKNIKCENLTKRDLKTGRLYTFPNGKAIELILVRLPVDTELKARDTDFNLKKSYPEFIKDLEKNIFGDRVQHILHYAVQLSKPHIIISLGVHGSLPSDFYEIETDIYGLASEHSKNITPMYHENSGNGKNYALAEMYKIF